MNLDVQKLGALEKLDEEFFKNPIDSISLHIENRLENLVVDQQIIRRRLIDAFTDGAAVELFFPGSQRNFLCQLMEHDKGILEKYEQEQGETLCCLTGMDATGEQPASIVISPLEPRTGNLQIMRAHRIVLRIYLGEHAYEYGTYLKGRTTVNGYQGHVLSMPVVSRTLNNVRLYRVNLSDETSFPVKLSIEGTDVEVNSQALNISAQGINEANLDSTNLEVEITENTLMQNTEDTVSVLEQMKDLKLRIALDDFGTGYSSLSYLTTFPVDTIKIDRSFVMGCGADNNTRVIIKAIVAMGHSLGMNIVAEGIESEDQLELLKKYGVDEGQGFYFSPGVSQDRFTQFLERELL